MPQEPFKACLAAAVAKLNLLRPNSTVLSTSDGFSALPFTALPIRQSPSSTSQRIAPSRPVSAARVLR